MTAIANVKGKEKEEEDVIACLSEIKDLVKISRTIRLTADGDLSIMQTASLFPHLSSGNTHKHNDNNCWRSLFPNNKLNDRSVSSFFLSLYISLFLPLFHSFLHFIIPLLYSFISLLHSLSLSTYLSYHSLSLSLSSPLSLSSSL